jgi:hypothetical protein
MNKGVLMVGVGDWFSIAAVSAIAFQQHHSGIPISIITDSDIQIDGIKTIKSKRGPWELKTMLNRFSPWEKTVYLDADVICLKPVPALFDYSFGIVSEPYPRIQDCTHNTGPEKSYTVRHHQTAVNYNTGVMCWNKVDEKHLFPNWWAEWLRFQGPDDQLALARSLDLMFTNALRCGASPKLSIQPIPRSYNFPITCYTKDVIAASTVHLLHAHTGYLSRAAWFKVARNVAGDVFHDPRIADLPEVLCQAQAS